MLDELSRMRRAIGKVEEQQKETTKLVADIQKQTKKANSKAFTIHDSL